MLEAGYELAQELGCSGEGCELPIRSPPKRKRDPSRIGYVSLPVQSCYMDPLLADLKSKDLGLSIQGLFLGRGIRQGLVMSPSCSILILASVFKGCS